MDDPQIFESMAALQAHEAKRLRAYRRDLAMRLHLTANEHEFLAVEKLSSDPEESARLEGVAQGLRLAAATVHPDTVTV